MHVTLVELRQTANGGIYVLAEFRHNPTDPSPFYTEDFTWNVVPRSRPRPVKDASGRWRQRNGQWKWPNNINEQQIDWAPFDADESMDAMLETMLKHAEGKAKVPPRNGRVMANPPASAGTTSAEFDALAARWPATQVDDHATVARRRRDRRRGLTP